MLTWGFRPRNTILPKNAMKRASRMRPRTAPLLPRIDLISRSLNQVSQFSIHAARARPRIGDESLGLTVF